MNTILRDAIMTFDLDPRVRVGLPTGHEVGETSRTGQKSLRVSRAEHDTLRGTPGVRAVDEWKLVVDGVNVYADEDEV